MLPNCLLSLIVKLREQNKGSMFQITLFDSQPCERFFRQMRTMTTMNYTKINFPLNDLLHLIQRVELQYDIIYNKLIDKGIVFPRISTNTSRTETTFSAFEMPSNEELVATIEKAKNEAIREVSKFGIIIDETDIERCEIKRRHISSKEIAIDNDDDDDSDSDEEGNSDIFSSIFSNRTEPINLPSYEITSQVEKERSVKKSTSSTK